jgi:hypothetical protein
MTSQLIYKDVAEERNEDLKKLLVKAFRKGYEWGKEKTKMPNDEQIVRLCDDQRFN